MLIAWGRDGEVFVSRCVCVKRQCVQNGFMPWPGLRLKDLLVLLCWLCGWGVCQCSCISKNPSEVAVSTGITYFGSQTIMCCISMSIYTGITAPTLGELWCFNCASIVKAAKVSVVDSVFSAVLTLMILSLALFAHSNLKYFRRFFSEFEYLLNFSDVSIAFVGIND